MTFVNLSILFGLAAVAIPIAIHLFNRRKAKPIDWGAMQFLRNSLVNRKRKILIEELILMALRCLLAGLIVLAFARPFLPAGAGVSWLVLVPLILMATVLVALAGIVARDPAWRWGLIGGFVAIVLSVGFLAWNQQLLHAETWKTGTEQDVAIVIDGSDSMTVKAGEASNFKNAVEEARRLTQSLRAEDRVTILVAGAETKIVTPEPVSVRGDLDKLFESLQPVGGEFAPVDAISAAATALAAGENPSKKIVVISDGQNRGWEADQPARWDFLSETLDRLPTRPKVIARFLPLPDQYSNAAVASIDLSRDVIGPDRETEVRVRVLNAGYRPVKPAGVQLRVDDGAPLSADVPPIEPGETAEAVFRHRFAKGGSHVLRASLLAEDDLAADDSQTRIAASLDELPILLIDGSGAGTNAIGAATFLEVALSPPSEESVAGQTAVRRLTRVTRIAAPDVKASTPFSDYRAVLLVDVPRIGADVATELAQYVRSGGGLLIVPGARSQPAFYDDWKLADGQPVIPAKLGERIVIEETSGTAHVAPDSFTHPALKRLVDASRGDLAGGVVSSYWRLAPFENDPGVAVGGRLDQGDPFLVERTLGRGRVLMTSVALDGSGDSLPAQVSFLPFIHELVYSVAALGEVEPNHAPTKSLALFIPAKTSASDEAKAATTVPVTFPDGRTERATLEQSEGGALATITGATLPGVYRLDLSARPELRYSAEVAPSAASDAAGASLPLSVIASSDEGRLEPLTEADESVAAKRLDWFRAQDVEQMVAAVVGDVPGYELWKYLALCAVGVVLAESFASRWIAGQRKLGATQTVDFISEGDRLVTFQDRAREFLAAARGTQ